MTPMADPESKCVESRKPPMTTRMPPPRTQKQTKKRKNMEDSPYLKLRSLLQQLRPHFIEVLRTPDFRNCRAADEIQKQVKLLMALNKQMTMDTGTQKKFASGHRPSHSKVPAKENKELPTQQVEPRYPVEKQVPITNFIPEKTSFVSSQLPGSYIVGSSVVGWNFITFSGSKPVYYGVTKDSYRSSHIRSEDAPTLSTDVLLEEDHLCRKVE